MEETEERINELEDRTITTYNPKFTSGSSTYLLTFSMFSFVSRVFIIACWSIFLKDASKSLSTILKPQLSWCCHFLIAFPPIQFEFVLILNMPSDLLLKLSTLDYVMRLWISVKISVLTGFIWHHSGREERALPCYCQVEVEVHVSHSGSLTPER